MNKQNKNFCSAFTVWEIVILILVVGFVVAIAIPNLAGNHHTSPQNACINNLRQIDAAANQFALEQSKTNGDAIRFPDDLTPYIKLNRYGKIPPCPAGGTYRIDTVGINPTCSLSNAVTPHVLP